MMKKFGLMMGLLFSSMAFAAGPKEMVNRIEPAFWFTGMQQTELQLMVYGNAIADASFSMENYDGVTVREVVKPGSPNYVLVYLNVNQDAKPGTLHFTFAKGKKKSVHAYELRQREKSPNQRMGFDASDVLYMLMPDRFANGNPANDQLKGMQDYKVDRTKPGLRHGGDIAGLRKHLDYFTDLGITALWFTPVLENDSPDRNNNSTYHGYATTDYYRVDPRFGTNEEYKALIDDCHKRGIKLVMDMIFNHCGFEHPWVKDMPSKDWFNTPEWLKTPDCLNQPDNGAYLQTSYKLTPVLDPYASKTDLKETTDGWFVKTMADLNQKNPHVLRYLIQTSKWWIETAGIDGIRMDTYPYADADAMAAWMKELNEEYPNFNVVGETWVTEPAYTAAWQKNSRLTKMNSHLPTVMDFSFFDKVSKAATEETDNDWSGLCRIYNNFVYDYLYEDPLHVMAFLENHDTDRFLGEGQDVPMLKQAMTLLLTTRRIPQLYYGTEVLLNGTKRITDGNVRQDFPGGWENDAHNCFTSQGRTVAENEMYDWCRKLLHWRKGNNVIAKGEMIHFLPNKGCYVYARTLEGKKVLVILNGTTQTTSLSLARYAEVIGSAKQAIDVTSGRTVQLQGTLQLAPRESLVLPLAE